MPTFDLLLYSWKDWSYFWGGLSCQLQMQTNCLQNGLFVTISDFLTPSLRESNTSPTGTKPNIYPTLPSLIFWRFTQCDINFTPRKCGDLRCTGLNQLRFSFMHVDKIRWMQLKCAHTTTGPNQYNRDNEREKCRSRRSWWKLRTLSLKQYCS